MAKDRGDGQHLERAPSPKLRSQALDTFSTEDVQRFKSALRDRAPKTVNNVLTVLNTLLNAAVE